MLGFSDHAQKYMCAKMQIAEQATTTAHLEAQLEAAEKFSFKKLPGYVNLTYEALEIKIKSYEKLEASVACILTTISASYATLYAIGQRVNLLAATPGYTAATTLLSAKSKGKKICFNTSEPVPAPNKGKEKGKQMEPPTVTHGHIIIT